MKGSTFLFLLFSLTCAHSQNTIGTLTYDSDRALSAYNLFYPNHQTSVFLTNNCGQIVNEWPDEEGTRPGISAKFSVDANLVKAKSSASIQNYFGSGGQGGVIEARDWDNNLLWQHIASDSINRHHHDFDIMPNGNILYISWHRLFFDDIVALGFDTIQNTVDELWFDCVKEYNPTIDSIVWEWCSYNHTVQELDPNLGNYNIVSENPDQIDINYQEFSFGREDWMHSNAVAYNEELDQVALSVRNFNEVWIIDHSTTTVEASQASGGLSNKGGRLLHRWGNPAAYNLGGSLDRKLFYPHNVKWVADTSSIYHNEILVYNNFITQSLSLGAMYKTPMDVNGVYTKEDGIFLPNNFTRSISHPDTTKNFSGQGSNIELLPNGNFFMHAASAGRGFELSPDNEVVWEYIIPLFFGEPVPQGETIASGANFNFSMLKYAEDFSGFVDKDLSPNAYLELEPNTQFCLLDAIDNHIAENPVITLFPNPADDYVNITLSKIDVEIKIFNLDGKCVKQLKSRAFEEQISVSDLEVGMYFVQVENAILKLVIW